MKTDLFDVLAPGKIVLCGEYAVVDGAPALVLAVDRGVRCAVRPGTGVVTPQDDDRFVAPALVHAPAARYEFSAWNPVDLPGKPGFGSSAAACVAACLAAGVDKTRAFEFHHAVQGGGSGLDVAASIAGGLIRFEAGSFSTLAIALPTLSVIWSGQSACTGPRVATYRSWAGREAFVASSAEIVRSFADDPVGVLAENAALLVAMAESAGLAYLTPALARTIALAASFGGAAKPSGAGGGDISVALFADPDAAAAFEVAANAEGLTPISVRASPGAARVPAGAEDLGGAGADQPLGYLP